MKDKSISVLLAVYNSEKYLDNCLNSILTQTFDDFELIIVNDGSTDQSAQICIEYAARDSRIKLFHTPNMGVGNARQFALEFSSGEYLCFVDSDDWLEKDMLEKLFKVAEKKKSDLVACDFVIETMKNSKIYGKSYHSCEEYLIDAISNKWGVLWKNLIKREIVLKNNIRFYKQFSAGEDYLFMIKCIYFAKSFEF